MEPTLDNCILSNAILNNSDPYDDHQVMYLVQLQWGDLTNVGEYYSRSEAIITKMRELGVDRKEVWDEIDRLYIDNIIEEIKEGRIKHLFSKLIRNVLEQLELKYGVK
tara:strand:- start:124 stop:447 length:324 start_codon:yes stop_codon:yes gene_type:complete